MIILGSATISIITVITIIGVLVITFDNDNNRSLHNRDYYVSMLNGNYVKITHDKQYYSFVEHYEEEIKKPASEQSKQVFDNLYSKDDATTGWNNYSSLKHDLTATDLSKEVTLDLDWTDLFKQVHLNDETIKQGENKLFHFYNIIANLYGKGNILKLLQYAKMDNSATGLFGYIQPGFDQKRLVIQQYMGLGSIFADQKIIIMELAPLMILFQLLFTNMVML
ncbi:hypothetical protein [Spiroplasma endosymbiont of Nebria brevicollis]|uniref:hypothetical protein n=1 Tax=Spiroplasma endosymbiont of Nebria brevicollis TaxID=3066284 RepID=UPI00313DD77E